MERNLMADRSNQSDYDEKQLGVMLLALACVFALGTVLVEWPTLVWSTLHFRPSLINPFRAVGVCIHRVFVGRWKLPHEWGEILPPLSAAIVLDVLLVVGLVAVVSGGAMRLGMWRGRSREHLSDLDPRKKVSPRSFAKPRDWAHLQPEPGEARSGALARVVSRPVRPLVGERRRPAPRGGDGWNMGRVRGREVRSAPEQHLLLIAPTRSGKTMRVVATEAHEHDGPLVVTSNKLDVLLHTIEARRRRGPVWVFAPMTPLPGGVECATWTPLLHCQTWPGALRMGQWLHDADPGAEDMAKGDGAAHFYDRGAVERLLPPVLHAAALADARMADVYHWLTDGSDALDAPVEILIRKGADRAALALRAVQGMDSRAQTILMMSAARLLAVYRFPEVQAADEDGFRPELLADNGTLYLIAPESEQEALAPIFGAMLGAILRECELNAGRCSDPRLLPVLKILADEAAHLAPLGKLPTYLSVSAGWSVRWLVVYQSAAQLRARYGQAADAITANALCKLFLGPIHDRATRDELVALLGERQIEQTSTTSGRWGESTTTRHEEPRPKLGGEQLAQLGGGQALAFHGRDLPALVDLPFWWEWQGCRSPEEALRRARQGTPEEFARSIARQVGERGGAEA
jgi:type IV secretion system protein VirD4